MMTIGEKFCEFIINCQFIEEQLKKGILFCVVGIKLSLIKTSSRISYNFSKEELDDLSMGQLINRFERFAKNKTLIKDLKILVKIRNEIVHKLFIQQSQGEFKLRGQVNKLGYALITSEECFRKLQEDFLNSNN